MKASVSFKMKQRVEECDKSIASEKEFLRQIAFECRRSQRSKQRFIVALVGGIEKLQESAPALLTLFETITRETDICGWYEESATLGILFSELGSATPESARDTINLKLKAALEQVGLSAQATVTVHILPLDLNQPFKPHDDLKLVQERLELSSPKRFLLRVKRVIDLAGSALLLLVLSPLMAAIAIAVKCGSRGPVLFRQTRVGQGGQHFTFLKFRSMAVASDHSLHENYVKEFIRGTAAKNKNEKGEGVFKLTEDPRVTPLGRFLRKSSFDELPQLLNVLRGDMSLVGPRPPIPYEVECYDLWHQRRVLELKPGITGLWQVSGRSRLGFDDMVRLDLQYAKTWSPWLDLKILLQTPMAVIGGDGAH